MPFAAPLAKKNVSSQSMQTHGVCPRGDDCIWAHTKPEVYFHPAEYKTQECTHYMSAKKCTLPTAVRGGWGRRAAWWCHPMAARSR